MRASAIGSSRPSRETGSAMHNTRQGAAESIGPLESGVMPAPGPSHAHNDPKAVSPEVVVKLISMLDEFERLFSNPPEAWAALKAEIEARKARWESRKLTDRPEPAEGDPGVSEPSPSAPTPRGRRPFVGFDRE